MTQERPTSLTVIGWLLIVLAAFALIAQFTMQDNPVAQQVIADSPMPAWAHMAFAVVGAIVTAACGYGILKGLNWSRYVYIGWSLFGLAFGLLTSPFTSVLLLSLVWLAVIGFFLFRAPANAWFTGSAVATTE